MSTDTRTHIHIHAYTYARVHAFAHVHTCICICTCMHMSTEVVVRQPCTTALGLTRKLRPACPAPLPAAPSIPASDLAPHLLVAAMQITVFSCLSPLAKPSSSVSSWFSVCSRSSLPPERMRESRPWSSRRSSSVHEWMHGVECAAAAVCSGARSTGVRGEDAPWWRSVPFPLQARRANERMHARAGTRGHTRAPHLADSINLVDEDDGGRLLPRV